MPESRFSESTLWNRGKDPCPTAPGKASAKPPRNVARWRDQPYGPRQRFVPGRHRRRAFGQNPIQRRAGRQPGRSRTLGQNARTDILRINPMDRGSARCPTSPTGTAGKCSNKTPYNVVPVGSPAATGRSDKMPEWIFSESTLWTAAPLGARPARAKVLPRPLATSHGWCVRSVGPAQRAKAPPKPHTTSCRSAARPQPDARTKCPAEHSPNQPYGPRHRFVPDQLGRRFRQSPHATWRGGKTAAPPTTPASPAPRPPILPRSPGPPARVRSGPPRRHTLTHGPLLRSRIPLPAPAQRGIANEMEPARPC